MPNELEQLLPTLDALDHVDQPDIPLDVDFQEIQELLTFIDENPAVLALLEEVGLGADILPTIRLALPAARLAQAQWIALSSPRKPEDQADAEDRGRKLKAAAISACRFTLRRSRLVQGSLNRIVEGEGVADLVQDLEDLARLIHDNLDGLAPNRRFDAPNRVPELRSTAQDVRLGLAEFRTATAKRRAVDIRNRAWTWLDDHVTELRLAGQYAYSGTVTHREFTSAYVRNLRRARRRKVE